MKKKEGLYEEERERERERDKKKNNKILKTEINSNY
jgi:hypothetical protein